MSIGFLKRLLLLLNVAAVLVLGAAAYGFYEHRKSMKQGDWRPPTFEPDVTKIGPNVVRIEHIDAPLGRFPEEVEKKVVEKKEEPKEDIESVLQRLGEITSAVVVYPPYDDENRPTITFKLKSGKKRVLALNEALEERPHPKYPRYMVPVRYQFIGCEPDPENPGADYFLFDMRCDGTDIQKMRWIGEDTGGTVTGGEALQASPVNDKKALIGISEEELRRSLEEDGKEESGGTDGDTPEPVEPKGEPIDRGPPTEGPIMTQVEAPDVIFDENRSGVFVTTRESHEYLQKNYNRLLKDAQTRVYKDPDTRRPAGVRVVRIARNSKANAFGIRPDDIILAVNDRTVTDRERAVNVVKQLLKDGVKILRVRIKRQGRIIEKRYDTRDPETRAAIKEYR